MKSKIYLILLAAVTFFTSCSYNCDKSREQIVKNGIADLTGWDYSIHRTIELNGDWEFYCNELLEPGDFRNSVKKASFIKVPGNWDSFQYKGKDFGSWGYATYRLRIITGNSYPLYFKLLPPNSACRIWANGLFYGESGKVGKTAEEEVPGYRLSIYEFKPVNNQIEVIIQVSNHSIYLGGLTFPAFAGTRDNIYDDKNRKIAFDVFIFASLLVISIYYLGLFLMRRSDASNLFFSVFTLLLSIRSLVTNEMFLYQLAPNADWHMMNKIDFLAMTLGVPVFIQYIYILYHKVVKKTIRLFFFLTSLIYMIMILFSPTNVYTVYLPFYNAVILLACIFVTYVLVRAVADRQEGAKLVLGGSAVLFLAIVNDILGVYNIIETIQLSSLGVFSFILMQSIISSMKFAKAYRRIEDLTHNLEIKVEQRTRELETEKALLRSRNEIIENELQIAKKIQMQILPDICPVESMYAFYKPMDTVGGDFYDFLKYRDPAKIGIFLSDVSGHGVPAAFITSMVKTGILQAGTDREDPAALLSDLNSLLVNQTDGHFVTAFYGIYDPETRELHYANSGHNSPFVWSSGNIRIISGKKSIPLAMLDNETLVSRDKSSTNNIVTLQKGDKILFYTDGLTEATSKEDRNVYFEETLLGELFVRYSDESPKDFIEKIYQELVEFHGSDQFEDDICMICMDIL